MDIPISWLKEYVDIDVSTKDFIEDITLSGSKVEGVTALGYDITNVVTGKIIEIKKHPDADKLQITKVDVGNEVLQIVTGAPNVFEGAYVPVAKPGAHLAGGVIINHGKLRGEESNGMLCSVEELGFDRADFPEAPENGIYIFKNPVELGLDVTDVLDLKEEVVEFEITSNRPDCFSMIGIARETAATYDKPLKMPEITLKEEEVGNISEMISIEIENPELCPRYIARVVTSVVIEPSPRWMRKRIRAAGLRPINNIVDITNYVMLELGQPMHAFDIDLISEARIIVRNAKEGEQITTLDGVTRNLNPSMLLITDPKKPVAIAGVMGGENSKITGGAKAILFESANFNGPNNRITAKKLGLRTDASSKFEKGLDPNLALIAVNRAVELVEMLNAGKVVPGMVDCYPNKREPATLSYSPEKINKLLGTDISEDEMIGYFKRFEIKADKASKTLIIPTFRPDLECNADLAEEVARLYGYDKITPTMVTGVPTVGKKSREQKIRGLIKNTMIGSGLCEAITFSFESAKAFDKLRIPKDSSLRKTVTISNPLGEDYSIMRTTTLNGMLTSLSVNFNRRNENIRLFEMSKTYIPKALPLKELPIEETFLTIGMFGDVDFYILKGLIENLFDILGINPEYSPVSDIPWLHPGRGAVVKRDENIGWLGEIHPEVAENYDIGDRVYMAAISVDKLIKYASLSRTYKPLPKFPSILRDISMLVKDDITARNIEAIISEEGGEFLESLRLFDVYKGAQIADGFKSMSYSITFRSLERTLTDEEVAGPMKKILLRLEKELSAVLRDK